MRAFWTTAEDIILIEETDEYRQGHRRRDGQLRKHLSSQAWDEISDVVTHRGGNNRSGTACASRLPRAMRKREQAPPWAWLHPAAPEPGPGPAPEILPGLFRLSDIASLPPRAHASGVTMRCVCCTDTGQNLYEVTICV